MNRVPPHDLAAERSVLGACMAFPVHLDDVLAILAPSDFYGDANCKIFMAIRHLHRKGEPADLVTVSNLLRTHGKAEEVGGLEYVSALMDAVPTGANVVQHARIVADKARIRDGLGVCLDFMSKAYEADDAGEYVASLARAVEGISDRSAGADMIQMSETISPTIQRLHEEAKKTGDVTGVPTGIPALDRMTAGLQPASLYVLAGRPSMGKSSIAMDIMDNAAQRGHPGAMFSLEMSVDQLVRRLLSKRAKIPGQKLRVPRLLDSEEWTVLADASDDLYSVPVLLDDSTKLGVYDIRVKVKKAIRRHGVRLVVIDYLGLMRPADDRASRERQIAEITLALKEMAKDLAVPVVLVSQLNRGPEARNDKRPLMSDLRDSGSIEQDADLVGFVYRESMYSMSTEDDSAELIIRKNRNGPVGTIHLRYLKEFTTFVEPEKVHTDDEQREWWQ